jgi:hypothetical protein
MNRNKIIVLVMAGFLLAAVPSVFAQSGAPDQGQRGFGPHMGMGMGGVSPELGTVVTMEYKKVTGQLVLGKRIVPVLKIDGQEYVLNLMGSDRNFLMTLKDGDTLTFEGVAETVKVPNKEPLNSFRPFKAVVDGKSIDLINQRNNMYPRMRGERSSCPQF